MTDIELDKWRKRLIASIGGWLKLTNQTGNNEIEQIKKIACNASGFAKFNEIPKQRLISLYYAFNQKQKDIKKVNDIKLITVEISNKIDKKFIN
ncbi:MAG: hypothetical protein LBV69_10135 [Bacteroidales bacterium]|jgi:hypothetical protein|nr:hypothetical protein [Bacteroidales bacterium]